MSNQFIKKILLGLTLIVGLFALAACGSSGPELEFRESGDMIQYRYVGESEWKEFVFISDITGPPGPEGPAGVQGPAGPAGSQGPAGPAGVAGPTVPVGEDGAQGPAGPAGATGATGSRGSTGSSGASGLAGALGADGRDGADGAAGEVGTKGDQGPTGPTGAPAEVIVTAKEASEVKILVEYDSVDTVLLVQPITFQDELTTNYVIEFKDNMIVGDLFFTTSGAIHVTLTGSGVINGNLEINIPNGEVTFSSDIIVTGVKNIVAITSNSFSPIAQSRIHENDGGTIVRDITFTSTTGSATYSLNYNLDSNGNITDIALVDLNVQVPGAAAPTGYGYHTVLVQRPFAEITHVQVQGLRYNLTTGTNTPFNSAYAPVTVRGDVSGRYWYFFVAQKNGNDWIPFGDHFKYIFTIYWGVGDELVATETLEVNVVDNSSRPPE